MYTVMTVCTGNICRSPMAEIILRAEFGRRGLADKVNVESSGVSDEEYGNPIDRRAVKVLKERGYELPDHARRNRTHRPVPADDRLAHARAAPSAAASQAQRSAHVPQLRPESAEAGRGT